MVQTIKELDFVINKYGTIGRVIKIDNKHNKVKMRKVSKCIGTYTKNVGSPYTFQQITSIKALRKNWKRIGTEQLLVTLFNNKNFKSQHLYIDIT